MQQNSNTSTIIIVEHDSSIIFTQISYAPESRQLSSDGHPLPLNEFLQKIRCHFVECNTYTRPSKPLNFHVSEIPPVVAPKLSGKKLWNTGMGKKSQHLKKADKSCWRYVLYVW